MCLKGLIIVTFEISGVLLVKTNEHLVPSLHRESTDSMIPCKDGISTGSEIANTKLIFKRVGTAYSVAWYYCSVAVPSLLPLATLSIHSQN